MKTDMFEIVMNNGTKQNHVCVLMNAWNFKDIDNEGVVLIQVIHVFTHSNIQIVMRLIFGRSINFLHF